MSARTPSWAEATPPRTRWWTARRDPKSARTSWTTLDDPLRASVVIQPFVVVALEWPIALVWRRSILLRGRLRGAGWPARLKAGRGE
jgi:hypothetical protein